MPGTFAVIGAGGWGTAVALHLAARPGNRVRLWAARPESAAALIATRENARQLPGVPIPPEITITGDVDGAVADADCWVVGVPTAFLRSTLERFRGRTPPRVVSLTKGIEAATFERPSGVLADVLGATDVAVLTGPSHAEEVARGMPTSLVAASTDAALAGWVQREFGSDRFRVYTNTDVAGVELAGALKNVLGVAAGICDGLGFGDNAKAALLTRGIVEVTRFGVAHGADPGTFMGLAGVGDLITTCFSKHGRNRRAGERLARGETLEQVTAGPQVAEGIYTCRSVYQRSTQMKLDVPIMAGVYAVVHEALPADAAVRDLMNRQQKGEHSGGQ